MNYDELKVDMPQIDPVFGTVIVLDKIINMLVNDSLWKDLKLDLRKRAEMGKKKYGDYLTTNNGRNAALDLYQEVLDSIMYATQLYLELEDGEHKEWALDIIRVLLEESVGIRYFLTEIQGVKLNNE